jgi:hypothetical protein
MQTSKSVQACVFGRRCIFTNKLDPIVTTERAGGFFRKTPEQSKTTQTVHTCDTGYFTSGNEPDVIINLTHNTFSKKAGHLNFSSQLFSEI